MMMDNGVSGFGGPENDNSNGTEGVDMPYICANLTRKVTSEKKEALKAEIAGILGIIPGKSEQALMVDIVDGKTIYFGGDLQENCAYVDVRLYGQVERDIKAEFTRAMFGVFHRVLDVAEDKMFLSLLEYDTWGTKGNLK